MFSVIIQRLSFSQENQYIHKITRSVSGLTRSVSGLTRSVSGLTRSVSGLTRSVIGVLCLETQLLLAFSSHKPTYRELGYKCFLSPFLF